MSSWCGRDRLETAGVLDVAWLKTGANNDGISIDRDRFLAELDRLATASVTSLIAMESTVSSDVLPTLREVTDAVVTVGNPYDELCGDVWHSARSGIAHTEVIDIQRSPAPAPLGELRPIGTQPRFRVLSVDQLIDRRAGVAGIA